MGTNCLERGDPRRPLRGLGMTPVIMAKKSPESSKIHWEAWSENSSNRSETDAETPGLLHAEPVACDASGDGLPIASGSDHHPTQGDPTLQIEFGSDCDAPFQVAP